MMAGLVYWQRMCLQGMSPSVVEAWAQPVITVTQIVRWITLFWILAHNWHDWQMRISGLRRCARQ